MTQVFAAILGPVKPWRLQGVETARTFELVTACGLTYNTGSPDILPADTAAAVAGGGVVMDLTAADYVIYTVQGSNTLSATTEATVPPAGTYALLWRVTLQGVDLYQQAGGSGGGGDPTQLEAGVVTVTIPNGANTGTAPVTFPTPYASAPVVVDTAYDDYVASVVAASITTTGFTARAGTRDASTVGSDTPVPVLWHSCLASPLPAIPLISTIAGIPGVLNTPPYATSGVATAIPMAPAFVAVDSAGTLTTAEGGWDGYKIDTGGAATFWWGDASGGQGYSGDGGLATLAEFAGFGGYGGPYCTIKCDAAGNQIITDSNNKAIRKVAAATDIVTHLCGLPENAGFPLPWAACDDGSGTFYITTGLSCSIWKWDGVTLSSWYTIGGFTLGDICSDGAGHLYVSSDNYVFKVDIAGVSSSLFAGTIGSFGYSGDGGPATSALLHGTTGVAVSATALYISDILNHVVRKVDLGTNIITTVAGNGTLGFSGDGGPATAAEISNPMGVAVDTHGGRLIICDGTSGITGDNYVLRAVTPLP